MSIGCSIKSRLQKVKTMSEEKEKARLKRLKEFNAAQVKYLESAGWILKVGEGWADSNSPSFLSGKPMYVDLGRACSMQTNRDLLNALPENVSKECRDYMVGTGL